MDLNKRKMEPCSKCNRFIELFVGGVGISSGDGGMSSHIQTRDGHGKICATEIWVCVISAVQAPKTGVNSELHQISEAALFSRTRRHTAG